MIFLLLSQVVGRGSPAPGVSAEMPGASHARLLPRRSGHQLFVLAILKNARWMCGCGGFIREPCGHDVSVGRL